MRKLQNPKRGCVSYASLRALFLVVLCFVAGDSVPVDCFASLAMTEKWGRGFNRGRNGGAVLAAHHH
ncbi:MAG: hypothetical protein HDT11_00455 [Helicobacter sp.]|nr:hypothetical protein [Helicobacter sp.]